MSIISSYNLTALTPAFSLLKLLPSGTAVLYLSTSFTCHLCANLSWKHSFFPLLPFHFPLLYLAPWSKAAHDWEHAWYARYYKPCLLHKTAFKGTKKKMCAKHALKHVSILLELKPNPHRLHCGTPPTLVIKTQPCKHFKERFYAVPRNKGKIKG